MMPMKIRFDVPVILAVVLCAVVVVGECATYFTSWYGYESDAEWSDGSVSTTLSSGGSAPYDIILMSGCEELAFLTIYVDEGYDDHYRAAYESSRMAYITQSEFAEQVMGFLSMRSYDDVAVCNSTDLSSFMQSTMGDIGVGLMVTSYALPSDVYDGTPGCLLFQWMDAGGRLYWVSSQVGRFFTDSEGLHEVEGNQTLFFGGDCINTESEYVATDVVDTGFTEALKLRGSNVMNGIDPTIIPGALAMGYSEGGYASIVVIPMGKGELTVFAGRYDISILDDIGQVIVTGITSQSNVVSVLSGDKGAGSETYEVNVPEGLSDKVLYVSIGGTYLRYAEAYYG